MEKTVICRGVRGATTIEEDTPESILRATRELLALMIRLNNIQSEDVASAIFTTTIDVVSQFPALAARQLGWMDVPMLCGHEMRVADTVPLCIRILINWNTDTPQKEIQHVYLKEAEALRPDKRLASEIDLDELNQWIDEQLKNWS
ncbi:MAG: chorismate mutase [Caldilineaceae bacterium]|nr:chorismate mutase [Caldilineaceae bacterium]MDE0077960.1 chorismate mutase [Caldilineaceae bacterium]